MTSKIVLQTTDVCRRYRQADTDIDVLVDFNFQVAARLIIEEVNRF